MDMKITNDNDKMPADINECWNSFKAQYPAAIFPLNDFRGYSYALAYACETIKATYSNMIAEHFQDRVEKFIVFKLQKQVPVSAFVLYSIIRYPFYSLCCKRICHIALHLNSQTNTFTSISPISARGAGAL